MSASGRVTCVSAARMLGLWIPHPPDRLHLAVHPHGGRDMSRFVAHRNLGPVRALPRSPLDAIENVLGVHAVQQVPLLGHEVDLLIGQRLVIQLDGFAYHQAAQRRADIAHDRRLRLAGYTVLRFDYIEVMDRWPLVERQILAAVAQNLHLA